MSFQWSMTFRLWLSHYTWPCNRLFWWDRGGYPNRLFSWDSLVDHSFQMTMDSYSKVFWVRGVWLIMTSCQASWSFFSRHFQWIESCDDMLHWGIFLLHHFLAVLAFRAIIHSRLRHSESPIFSLAFRATIHSRLWRSESPIFSLAFRVTMSSQPQHSESSFSASHP